MSGASTAAPAREGETLPGIGARTLCEAFQATAAAFGDLPALRAAGGGATWSWGEYAERVERVAAGLAALGVSRGDTVGLLLRNRPEFHWCDTAAMHLGAIGFSIYQTSAPGQVEDVLRNAGNRVLITQREFHAQNAEAFARCPDLAHVVLVDDPIDGTMSLHELEAVGDPDFDLERRWRAVEPEDVAALIYTSGTSGPPKGVELTHANLMYEVRAFAELYPATEPGERVASYLPMAHLAERAFSHYHSIARATFVTCVDDPAAIVGALQEIRPTWFVGVPRVWEKIRAALESQVQGADEARLAELRSLIGLDRVKTAVVGGAPTAREVHEFFGRFGIPLHEVWGLTESAAVVTVNRPEDGRPGTVGRPFADAEVRIAADGEILVRGPMTMRGYRRDPWATAEAIDADGWLHTGDVGELDADGYLRLVDRKKELIVNAAGKNMSPANIEGRIKLEHPAIQHAVAIGDRRPYNVALLALDPAMLGGRDPHGEELRAELREAVGRANRALSRVEQIKRFAIVADEWQPGGDEVTPTMKLRRKQIVGRYAEAIEELYAASPSAAVVEVARPT
jgi:long-chain acyl-CoA synthetase